MKTLSLKLPDDMAQELSAQARSRGTTKSEVLREALVDFLAKAPQADKGSFLDLAGDLVGRLEGPGDLSYNKKYLANYDEEHGPVDEALVEKYVGLLG